LLGRQRRQNRPQHPGDNVQLPGGGKGRRFSDRGVDFIQNFSRCLIGHGLAFSIFAHRSYDHVAFAL
jgi:hypothetical protein